ncbi:MAG TPA: enoyl-CoA hydratase-related protein [Candidatus Acidoferrales bacterium]|nr:enoyl-CoA hydratase-related protein [Candidatus Acidoferrales bacterium]
MEFQERRGKHILLSKEIPIAVIYLNRPDVLNALNHELMIELTGCLEQLDSDESVKCIVITGNEKAFAAGADIKEMADADTVEMLSRDDFSIWDKIRKIKKPLIAAVSGFALGGGCELAMMCDMIIASETAKFGQPEINIGVMPGAGGTQRLTKSVGKYKAMELVLTGEMMDAEDAMRLGLVNRVVPVELYLEEAKKLARVIASKPPLAVRLVKESVLKSFEMPLREGLEMERKNFYALFSSQDQKEGMKAFIEKRKPQWKGK